MVKLFTPESAVAVGERVGLSPAVAAFVVPLAIVAGGWLAGLAIEAAVRGFLAVVARRSSTRLDDLLLDALRGPIRLFSVLAAAAVAVTATPAPPLVRGFAETAFVALVASAAVAVAARLVGGLVLTYGARARLAGSAARAVRRVAVLVIWAVGGLVVLDNAGVSISPLLTTLGLAGLAAALALQDTLSNLFAGLYVQSDRPLEVGHYVRVEDLNVEGYVFEVGWRTTKIRTLANNLVVVPNSRLAQSVVTDYDLPEPRMSLLVRVPVTRESDMRRLEATLVDEATRAAGDVPGVLVEPAPFMRFIPGFTDHGYEVTLIVQVEKFVDQYLAQHELRHRIVARLHREGFETPYPVRVLRMDGAGAGATGLVPAPREPATRSPGRG